MLKAIETRYNGYRFRSRLEARWAVFFDTVGMNYRYESEGFELFGERYLPDFFVPELNTWMEIKPENPTARDHELCHDLWLTSKQTVLLIAGQPWVNEYQIHYKPGLSKVYWVDQSGEQCFDVVPVGPFVFGECRKCDALWLCNDDHQRGLQRCDSLCTAVDSMRPPLAHYGIVAKGYERARSARFEFGEQG